MKKSAIAIGILLMTTIILSFKKQETVIENTKLEKPNVIFILTDDQGFGDMSVAGHPYLKTPNMDRLAREGTRFTQFYVNASVCAPSRVALMTGQFPARNNVHHIYINEKYNLQNGVPDYLDPCVLTVADVMKKAGYVTGHIGKWHLCGANEAPGASEYGFDVDLTATGGTQSSLYGKRWKSSSVAEIIWTSSHWIMNDAIDFIERREKDKPFYLNLWTYVPHAPLKPTEEALQQYANLTPQANDFSSWMSGYADSAADLTNQMKVYCASMTSLDAAIGKLLDYLNESGLAENTLILFASDNGPEDYHVGNAVNSGMGSPGVFRGRKRSLYEGGIRVPCIVRWPGHVPAGRVSDAVWSGVDWLPTLARITGVSLPESFQADGEDVSDILYGAEREHKMPLFWEWKFVVHGNKAYRPPQLAVREGDWKLFCNPDGSDVELYNLSEDPEERKNLAAQQAKLAEQLKITLLDWKRTIPESAHPETSE